MCCQCLHPMLQTHGQKAHLPCRFTEESHSWSDGWLCPVFVLLPSFPHTFYQVGASIPVGCRWLSLSMIALMAPCGVVWFSLPITQDCRAVLWALPAPLAAATDGLLSVSELLWALTLFLHTIWGWGNWKHLEIWVLWTFHRSLSQVPSAFLGRSAPHPLAFLVAVPALGHWPLQLHLVGKMHLFLRKHQPLYRDGGRTGKWGCGWYTLLWDLGKKDLLASSFLFPLFLSGKGTGRDEAAPGTGD